MASFREEEEVRVFLLSHRAGAAGLTLVRANHVFLLEPALDPSIEQQAVARVHRIGQQRCVAQGRLGVGGVCLAWVLGDGLELNANCIHTALSPLPPFASRPVVVTRLLVRDSIEHRVLAVQEAKHALFAGADGAAEDTAGERGRQGIGGLVGSSKMQMMVSKGVNDG